MAMRAPGSGDGSPIFVPGKGAAVLCLHGFTGTPYEVAPLARALANAGFSVSAPVLAGHGQKASDLAKTRWTDWFASAEAAFDRLHKDAGAKSIALAGFSMGALLALHLASQRPHNVSALAVFSTPLRLRNWHMVGARAWKRMPAFLRCARLATLRKRGGSDVTDESVRRENPAMLEMPLAGVAELVALADVVRRELSLVRSPTFVAHGEQDHTVPLASSYELAGSLASDVVERLWLPRSGHLIGVDVEHHQLCDAVVRFFKSHSGYPGANETTS
jgi:carboxylesterase